MFFVNMYFKNLITLATAAAYAVQTTAAENIYEIAANSDDFTTLADAIKIAGLDDELSGNGPFTVFAPSNSAFGELPAGFLTHLLDPVWKPQLQNVLLYHVTPREIRAANLTDGMTAMTIIGEDININLDPARVNNVTISTADIDADNGVIHGIDGVLTPVSVTSNVVDIIAGDDQLSTALMALGLAGLDTALLGNGPFTVFAPTNEAFNALPQALTDRLLLPENIEQLTNVLKYHVVAANADTPSLTSGDIETLNGKSVEVDISDRGITVGGANFVGPDMIAINGIIHAIDTVLIPPADGAGKPGEEETEQEDDTTEQEEEMSEQEEGMAEPEEETTEPEEESVESEEETTESEEEPTETEEESTEAEEESVESEEEPANDQNIVDIGAGDEQFSTLITALKAAGLAGTLSGEGPFTVFAPTNDAFAALPEGTVESLLQPKNVGALTDILQYHVVAGNAPSTSLTSGEIETLNGDSVNVDVSDGRVTVNGANVIIPDVIASNGVIHVIDAVLTPPFEEPAEVTELTKPEEEITESDEETSEQEEEEPAETEEESVELEEEPANDQNIVDIGAGDEQFSTLITALKAAGLAGTLSGEGPFTVFAPTNDAFAALPEGTVESLLQPKNVGALTDILQYHVVAGNAPSTSLTSGEIETLNGDSVNVDVSDGRVTVNGANVIIPDVIASNGVIHVIDAVLIPPSEEPADGTAETAGTPKPTKMPSMLPLFPKSAKVFTKTAKGSKSSKTTKVSKASKATTIVVSKSSKATKTSKASEATKASKASKSVKSGKMTKIDLFH
mmetsp:Transcript_6063/g.11792  ORF Transcript_6063/g.11792 Transcript_6063/m.11792 type:complete len:796 (-) Transcript_6063:98-2485(-)